MAKGSNSLSGKRSRAAKPYDANNSFVKKVATKVTDLIPQRSWISKWFNTSQDNGDVMNDTENPEDSEPEEEMPQPPPSKRPRIRMDVTHPPGTFTIEPRSRTSLNEESHKGPYPIHNETADDFLEPPVAGPSGTRRLVSSTPAVHTEVRSTSARRDRAELISLSSTQNNGTANGTDDNSESSESTSGCSSLIPQVNRQEAPSSITYNQTFANRKIFMEDKLNFTSHLQSPRSLFIDSTSRDTLSSRRPSFNASIMNNTLDRGPALSSPFYSGNTTFGGANAAGFHRRGRTLFNNANEIQLKVPRRTNVQVKPSNAAGTDSSGMSQTAKRILEALEHFSSPILDAKKIPLNNTERNVSAGSGKKRQREEERTPKPRVGLRHLSRELIVPTVPDLIKLRRRQKLQDTTVAARKIVSAQSIPPPTQEYRLRSDADEKSKYAGKLKSRGKTDLDEEDTPEAVNLPNITLPITSLPNFDIGLLVGKGGMNRSTSRENSFQFASPIKVTESSKTLKSINNFTFSKPINANDRGTNNDSNNMSRTLTIDSNASSISSSSMTMTNFIWSGSKTAPKLKEKPKGKEPSSEELQVASVLKTGSVMDVLGKKSDPLMDAWKPSAGMWECDQCLISNSADEKQCVACKASKPNSDAHKTPKVSCAIAANVTSATKIVANDCFGSQFKKGNNQWECDSCLVRNKQTDIKCVSCTAPKPGTAKAAVPVASQPEKSDLMAKFKPAEGSWECPGCMLRNPSAITTCPCCSASKPGSLKISPKKAAGKSGFGNTSSACSQDVSKPTLNVSHSSTSDSTDKSKPSKTESSVISPPKTSAKIDTVTTSGFGDKFKKPEGAWTCNDCMVPNKGEVTECVACGGLKPGAKKPVQPAAPAASGSTLQFNMNMPANAGNFKFGIDKASEKPDTNKTAAATGFSFTAKSETAPTSGFTFGVPTDDKKNAAETPKPTGFTFGVQKVEENKTGFKFEPKVTPPKPATKKRSLDEGETKTDVPFSFGVPKTEESKPTAGKQFAFGAPSTTATIVTPAFSFGSPKADPGSTGTSNEVPKMSFAVPATETTKPSIPSTVSTTSSALNTGGSTIAVTSNTSKTTEPLPAAGFTFGANSAPATTTAAAATPALFSFNASTTTPAPQTSSAACFVQTPASVPAPVTSSMFVFGGNKAAETIAAPVENKPSLSFGSIPAQPAFSAPSSASLFGGAENKTAPAFGSNENKNLPAFGVKKSKAVASFGANESKPTLFGTPENSVPAFGSADANVPRFEATENKFPAFGSAGKPPPPAYNAPSSTFATGAAAAAPAPAFGSSGPPAFGTPPPAFGTGSTSSMFAATKASDGTPAPAPGLFSFGTSAAQATSQPSNAFNFSGSNSTVSSTPAAAQKSLFTFGGSSNAAPAGNGFGASTFNAPAPANPVAGSFTFNAPKPEAPAFGQTVPATTSMFGAPQGNPAFGQSQPTPAFGSTAPAPSSGFNFGATAPAAPSGGFTFTGAAPPAATSSGFNFTASPGTPLSFNFTGGSAPVFNATPQTQQRKIKKAVRRTQPR